MPVNTARDGRFNRVNFRVNNHSLSYFYKLVTTGGSPPASLLFCTRKSLFLHLKTIEISAKGKGVNAKNETFYSQDFRYSFPVDRFDGHAGPRAGFDVLIER